MSAKHVVFGEKLFAVQADHNPDITVLVCSDTVYGPTVATMETPDETGFMDGDHARAIAGEIERRWNIHGPLARALSELRAFIGKPGSNAGEAEIALADAVLLRLQVEPGGEKVLAATRERFEAWFRARPDSRFVQQLILERGPTGRYTSAREQEMWEAFSAANSDLPTPIERRLTSLINQFFEAWPNIDDDEHVQGSDMVAFVTDWMRDARKELDEEVLA